MDDETTLSPQVETSILREAGVLSISFGQKVKQVTLVLVVLQEALPGGR